MVDILSMIHGFWGNGAIPRAENSSFITLIPKDLTEFWPISLIGCMYKIIFRVLAIRLRRIIHKLIDEKQSAFVRGRNMLDSILIVNEVVDDAKRRKKPCLIFKVYFKKAYDYICWDFLIYMMVRMSFNHKWISGIKTCLEMTTISILVNGSPTEEFKPRKRLRQGDIIASFLYLIVAEGLSSLMRQALKMGKYVGHKVGIQLVEVSLLQFVDDSFLCGGIYTQYHML